MKRSSSPTTPVSSSPSASGQVPVTPSPKKFKKEHNTPPSGKKIGTGNGGGIWTTERFSMLSEEILAAALETMDKDAVAAKLGVSKSQLVDQLKPNRSNFRKKFLEWAKGI